jgi:hypothetical protein
VKKVPGQPWVSDPNGEGLGSGRDIKKAGETSRLPDIGSPACFRRPCPGGRDIKKAGETFKGSEYTFITALLRIVTKNKRLVWFFVRIHFHPLLLDIGNKSTRFVDFLQSRRSRKEHTTGHNGNIDASQRRHTHPGGSTARTFHKGHPSKKSLH